MAELTPADPKRCQADVPNGVNFMTLGGRPGRVRCSNEPVVSAKETKPGKDGQMGSMSLCDSCLTVFTKQVPQEGIEVEKIGGGDGGGVAGGGGGTNVSGGGGSAGEDADIS